MRWLARTAFGLAIAAVALAALGGSEAISRLRYEEGNRRARSAADALNGTFRRAGDALETTADVVSRAWDGPGTAPIHEGKALEEAWGRVAVRLATARPPAGTVVAVYDETPETATDDFKCSGYWTDGRIVRDGLAGWSGLVPETILHTEAVRSDGDLSTTGGLVWFTEDGRHGARLHRAFLYTRPVEDPKTKEESTEDVFIEASMPFHAAEWASVSCDVKDGRVEDGLPWVNLFETRPESALSASAISPKDTTWRFPVALDRPRGSALARQSADWPQHTVALGGVALALVLAAGGLWWAFERKAVAAAPDITAEAAHELKTPLTAMRGALEVALRRERTPAEYRETLAGTLEEVKGLQNLLTSVLLLTRGAASPRADESVDLAAIVRAEVERVKGQATERIVTLRGADDPATVMGDPSLLARAVGNLLDNAMLHSVAGGAIEVEIARGNGAATVTVLDEGPGIPEARRERVFERFYRGPEVGQRGIPGAGLGLPISRWIAQSHGGSLTLDPSVAGRSRFVLRVPLATSQGGR